MRFRFLDIPSHYNQLAYLYDNSQQVSRLTGAIRISLLDPFFCGSQKLGFIRLQKLWYYNERRKQSMENVQTYCSYFWLERVISTGVV